MNSSVKPFVCPECGAEGHLREGHANAWYSERVFVGEAGDISLSDFDPAGDGEISYYCGECGATLPNIDTPEALVAYLRQ